VQRDVVIAWYDDLRLRESVEEGASLYEFARTRPLSQVTRDGHHGGVDVANSLNQRFDDCVIDAAEMDVG